MFFNSPNNNKDLLGGFEEDMSISDGDPADIMLAYIGDRKQQDHNLLALKVNVKGGSALWIAYYMGTSEVDTDINRDSINKNRQENRLKGVGIISINEN